MSTLAITKSVFFERFIPTDMIASAVSIECTQKRLALQDALNTNETDRALEKIEEYRGALESIIKLLETNRSKTVLKEQPQFDWAWGSGSYMSSCWRWEKLMTYAVGYDINMASAMKKATGGQFKEASQHFNQAGEYCVSIVDNVLPEWQWKEVQSIHMTMENFWKSKVYFIYAMKDLMTLQYGISQPAEISDKNAIRIVSRMEGLCKKSLAEWSNQDNSGLMNWARAARAVYTARSHAEKDEFGKAIGLVQNWDGVLTRLVNDNHLNIIMENLVVALREITDQIEDWRVTNAHVHFHPIETPVLSEIEQYDEITNKINSL
jgi:hypothetical protein